MSIKLTQGLHCRACDAMFDSNDFDDELCLKCYMAMLLILDPPSMSDKDFDDLLDDGQGELNEQLT